jgi:predicted membrane protein
MRIQDGTPSYTNPFSALFLVLFLTFLFPAAFTNIVKAVTTSTIIAVTVGTYTSLEFCPKTKPLSPYQDHLLFQVGLL